MSSKISTSPNKQSVFFKQRIVSMRMAIPLLLLVFLLTPSLNEIVLTVLAEAFLQVSAFVALTLSLYYSISHNLNSSTLHQWLQNKSYREIIFAGFMGVLPGCGGAIIIITQYTQGKIGFGAVVAVLTSTMGDAAFLLISQKPDDAVLILSISVFVGIISGLICEYFLPAPKKDNPKPVHFQPAPATKQDEQMDLWVNRLSLSFWCLLLIPAGITAILIAFQVEVNALLNLPANTVELIGALAGFICLLLWALSAKGDSYAIITKENDNALPKHWIRKVAQDTQFVTTWVVVAFLIFELALFFMGDGFLEALKNWGSTSVLVATIIGLLPGCGPQIMVTGLYLQGAIPLSAQLANAISNDGDALFPAIALAPRAALLATLYSTVPALITGYSYYWFVELAP
ncbi:putative manganese transporter [Marinomonas dokdonensis]|uniref:putative manganese transporter n=1 Tax=Marinomonas dokdonensis TaxID=328224 RepID=UPI0040553A0A